MKTSPPIPTPLQMLVKNSKEDLVPALAEDSHLSNESCFAYSFSGSDEKVSALKKKLRYLDEHSEKILCALLKTSKIVAWSLQNLSPAHFLVKHYFGLTDSRCIHHRPRRMAPGHNEFIWKELDSLLEADIMVPASALWSFSAVIASKKDGNFGFCVQYCFLNRVLKADRWPLLRIEEVFKDLRGSKLLTTLDLFNAYWQIRLADSCREMTTFTTHQ